MLVHPDFCGRWAREVTTPPAVSSSVRRPVDAKGDSEYLDKHGYASAVFSARQRTIWVWYVNYS